MSSITDGLNHLIDKMVETDRRMARRAGQHIDNTNRILEDARQGSQSRSSSAKALPSAMPIPFAPAKRKMTKTWLAELVKPYKQADPKKFKGITAAKKLSTEKFASWLTERDIAVMQCWEECLNFPSPMELLSYWRQQGSPQITQKE
jgi:hypothetical protein